MGFAITVTFAFCLWIVLWSVGVKSFDGALLALVIIAVGAGVRLLKPRNAADPRD